MSSKNSNWNCRCPICKHFIDWCIEPMCSIECDESATECSKFEETQHEYRVQYWINKGGTHNVYYFHDYDEARCHYMKWIMNQVLETKHVEKVCFESWSYRDEKYKTIFESLMYHPA